jgi:hypothetical protein
MRYGCFLRFHWIDMKSVVWPDQVYFPFYGRSCKYVMFTYVFVFAIVVRVCVSFYVSCLPRLMKWQTTVCSTVIRYIFFMLSVHTWTSDFDLKSHTNYTSKNINIIIKIHPTHVASKCKIFNTVKVLFPPEFRHKVLLRGSDKKHQNNVSAL